jgi:hypothetical protein
MNERMRPWYGIWPPRPSWEGKVMKIKIKWQEQRLSLVMFIVFLLGIILLLASYDLMQIGLGDPQLVHDIGIGFIVAGILGVSVDQILRRQLAVDAFRASIGYLLPEELRNEMEWIYSSHILCIEHSQTCELQSIDEETCSICTKTIRKFRNVSSSKELARLSVAIDEWFHNVGTSKILDFGYTKLGTQIDNFEITKSTHSIGVKEQEVALAPGEEITYWCEAEEIKHKNDVTDWVFSCPTLNPIVIVKAFQGISFDVGFGYRSPAEELGSGTYRLKGTLLPGQRIEIRWWKVKDSEKWLSENPLAMQ